MLLGKQLSHYLTAHYTTRQLRGIHIDARCTCGAKLKGAGADQSAALTALWSTFKNHLQSTKNDPS